MRYHRGPGVTQTALPALKEVPGRRAARTAWRPGSLLWGVAAPAVSLTIPALNWPHPGLRPALDQHRLRPVERQLAHPVRERGRSRVTGTPVPGRGRCAGRTGPRRSAPARPTGAAAAARADGPGPGAGRWSPSGRGIRPRHPGGAPGRGRSPATRGAHVLGALPDEPAQRGERAGPHEPGATAKAASSPPWARATAAPGSPPYTCMRRPGSPRRPENRPRPYGVRDGLR